MKTFDVGDTLPVGTKIIIKALSENDLHCLYSKHLLGSIIDQEFEFLHGTAWFRRTTKCDGHPEEGLCFAYGFSYEEVNNG